MVGSKGCYCGGERWVGKGGGQNECEGLVGGGGVVEGVEL